MAALEQFYLIMIAIPIVIFLAIFIVNRFKKQSNAKQSAERRV